MSVTQTDISVIMMDTQGDVLTGTYNILYFQWSFKAATGGEDLLAKDADANEIKRAVTDGSNFERDYLIKDKITDFTLTVLDGGVVYVHLMPHAKALVRY